jgi:hypothetical protein
LSHESDAAVLPIGVIDEAASETTVSCWMVRGPITASTALCATALPVPKAIPEISVHRDISTTFSMY